MRFKQVISLVLAASVLAPSSIAVNAADKTEPAKREYVISEFVRSVGRNNLTIKTDQTDKILKAFTDSEDVEEEYRDDIARAKAYNLIKGYEDGTLKPLDTVRRIEAMVMLSRALPDELDEVTEPIGFSDVPEWAKADIDRLSAAGLVKGYGDGTLGAEDRITVEQVGLITDRSDNILNTVDVGESFYGYVNNKIMRNYDASGETVIDPIHGALITTETSWSHFEDRMQEVSEQEMDVLKRLIDGEIEFEKGTAEQRVYDFYDCIKHIDEDRPKDRETYYEFRDRIIDANTPEELMAVAADLYKETGVRILYYATAELDKDSNIACPTVQMMAPEYASMIAFDDRSEKKYAEKYKDALADYAALVSKKFDKHDAKLAYQIQRDTMSNENYMFIYILLRAIRMMIDDTYTEEQFEADIEYIEAQHPEMSGYDSEEETQQSFTVEELDALGDIKLGSVLSEIGFHDFDKIIVNNGYEDIIKNTKIDANNLDAYKINAVMQLSSEVGYTPTTSEEKALENLNLLSQDALAGISYPDDDYDDEDYGFYIGEDVSEDEEFEYTISRVAEYLPNDIGIVFCHEYFTDDDYNSIGDIYYAIKDAYAERFDNNEWLDDETKENAKKKLEKGKMTAVVGYPDNYGFIEIVPREEGGTFTRNMMNINKETLKLDIQACADPSFIHTMMLMPPDEVNACYIPTLNSLNIPAGILGDIFYDRDRSYAQNLGSIGAIIGHEIGHAFDDSGSQYDENGSLKNWWSDEAAEEYEKIKQYFIDYYEGYEVVDGVVQDSATTIGENMADFAGMTVVMDILKGDKEAQKEALEAYASVWARIGSESLITSEYYLQDVHSSDNVRVDAVVASLPEFYEIYDIDEDDPMYVAPEDRLKLW